MHNLLMGGRVSHLENIHIVQPPPPSGLSTFSKLIIFTLRNFFYPHAATPPPRLSTFGDPPPPYPQKVDNLPFFFKTLPLVLGHVATKTLALNQFWFRE